jgi:hypothetical protein
MFLTGVFGLLLLPQPWPPSERRRHTPRELHRFVSSRLTGGFGQSHKELTRSETEMPNDFAILTRVLRRGSRVPRSIFW